MPEETLLDKGLVVIGDEDAILGFKALGFKVYSLKERGEFDAVLAEVVDKKDAVCLVQEDIYLAAKDQINNYRDLPIPIFIPFAKNAGMSLLERMVKDIRLRATGTF